MNSLKDICGHSEQQKCSNSINVAELYFLIQKFIACGPLKKTKEVLMKELEEHKIYQKRLDWEGNEYNRSFEDMVHQFPFIRPDYLLQICNHIANISSENSVLPSKNAKSMLKFRSKSLNENDNSFKQLFSLVTRLHGIPLRDKNLRSNIANILRAREVTGAIPRGKFIMPRLYSALQVQRKTLGHLSSVYCLVFDATGRYILTGADDLLVKLWSSYTGRLLASFRGAQYEISDISVNVENTLLAAGSLDHILRVWSLQTGAPVAVLTGHSAMITTVNFCPSSCWNLKYLVSTGSDGAVVFWTYSYDTSDKITFKNTPTVYLEKMRPGGAKMISSAFSPGGSFLATGSADHNVRVYYMKGDEGPQRILESELHNDRVDSIQWAHSGIRFVSGSKDGSAVVWYFEDQQWKHICLHMSTKLDGSLSTEDAKKMKVTMVAWDVTDELFVTAVSDHTLKVWSSSNGQLQRVLTGHTDDFFVLECHPSDRGVMLSAGHDGQVFIWDIFRGEIISRFINSIEGQGVGAIYDGKWSPDGTMIAFSDSHGRIITLGFGPGSAMLTQLPSELFFHTDYRPLIRDRNHHILDEQTQVPPHLMPPPFLVDIDGNPYPPIFQRLVPGREDCLSEQLVPNVFECSEGGQEVIQGLPDESHSEPERLFSNNGENVIRNNRRSRDIEGVRQTTGDWQRDFNIKWKKNVLVPPLKPALLHKVQRDIENLAQAEVEEYHKQMCSRPHMINTSHLNNTTKLIENKNTKRIIKKTKYVPVPYTIESSEEEEVEDYANSSDYSDWELEEGVNLEPPKRSKRRQVTHQFTSSEEEDDQESDRAEESVLKKEDQPSTSNCDINTENDPEADPLAVPSKKQQKKSKPHEVPEKYKPSEWLTETKPRKSPYFPQMGDELVYLFHGHQLYVEAVRSKHLYPINIKDLPWNKIALKDFEYVKIVGIRYEIKPPRICCLKLALLDKQGKLAGRYMTVKHHDIPDVLDFFVLKQTFDVATSRNWSVGDRFRCMIYDEWWLGKIISTSLDEHPDSPFLCYEIQWDNGETERMSPWDLEPVDESRVPNEPSEAVPVLEEELKAILYSSTPEDWNNIDVNLAHQNILQGLSKIMELAIAEPFLVPVDLNIYPTYSYVIEYPIDLSTIRARFEYNFYRRISAAQFDIRYLATNAEKFNEKHTAIVKHARILTDLCLRVVKQCDILVDVSEVYRSMVDSYHSSENEIDIMNQPSTSYSRPTRIRVKPVDLIGWKSDALSFINQIWDSADSLPFRNPVSKFRYPDYYSVIKTPMDLTTVREKLQTDKYDTPYDFGDDMKLIFENSKIYNTNPKSRIYLMTARLSSAFEEYHRRALEKWCRLRRRQRPNPKILSSSSSSDDSEYDTVSSRKNSIIYEEDSNISVTNNNKSDSTNTDSTPASMSSSCNASTSRPRPRRKAGAGRTKKVGESSSDKNYRVLRSVAVVTQSEDDNDSSSTKCTFSDSDEQPISSYRKRPLRKIKAPTYADENSSDSEVPLVSCLNRNRRTTRRKPSKYISSESDIEERTSKRLRHNGESSKFLTSVSSRGRIRKLTARAQAMMKKSS